MQPTLPPRLHIKLQSSTDTTLDQAPEPFPNIALIMSLLKCFVFCLFDLNFLSQLLFFILILYCRYDQTLYLDSNFPFLHQFFSLRMT